MSQFLLCPQVHEAAQHLYIPDRTTYMPNNDQIEKRMPLQIPQILTSLGQCVCPSFSPPTRRQNIGTWIYDQGKKKGGPKAYHSQGLEASPWSECTASCLSDCRDVVDRGRQRRRFVGCRRAGGGRSSQAKGDRVENRRVGTLGGAKFQAARCASLSGLMRLAWFTIT